jgi:hypothetical protein
MLSSGCSIEDVPSPRPIFETGVCIGNLGTGIELLPPTSSCCPGSCSENAISDLQGACQAKAQDFCPRRQGGPWTLTRNCRPRPEGRLDFDVVHLWPLKLWTICVSWQLQRLANPVHHARTQADIRRQVIGFMRLTEKAWAAATGTSWLQGLSWVGMVCWRVALVSWSTALGRKAGGV